MLDRLRAVTPAGQTFSAGLVAIEGRAANPLLRAVDDALYQAKSAGRACNVVSAISIDATVTHLEAS